MTISTKPALSTSLKVSGNRTTYKALQLCDESVYDMARHYYTLDEIAERFSVSKQAILEHHGDAFHMGKDNASNKPRMLLNQLLDEYAAKTSLLDMVEVAGPKGPKFMPPDNMTLIKALELKFKRFDGMGTKSEVTVSQGAPLTPADVKFKPLTAANFDKPWVRDEDIE